MTDICTIGNIDNLKKAAGLIVWFIFIGLAIYVIWQLKEVRKIEKKIDLKQKEIDDLSNKILQRVRNSLVNQGQLDRMVAKEQEPLDKKLRDLKRQRQYILDKLPLMGFFKK